MIGSGARYAYIHRTGYIVLRPAGRNRRDGARLGTDGTRLAAPTDIEWLRSAFACNWPTAYPQPFVGTGPEDAMLSLYWKSAAATITLEIDTRNRMGDLYRTVPNCAGDQDEALELNLSSAYAWRKIGMALGA